MKIKVIREFLGVPVGSIGECIATIGDNRHFDRCELKFDCKENIVLMPYPCEEYFIEIT